MTPLLLPCSHCTRNGWPSPVELAVVACATCVGLVLFGLAAAVHLAWSATDVDLPTEDDLRAELWAGVVA